jgi:hypothetical protein
MTNNTTMNTTDPTTTTAFDPSAGSPAITPEPAAKPAAKPYRVTATIKAIFEFYPGEVATPEEAVAYAAEIIRELDLSVSVDGVAIQAEWSGAPELDQSAPSDESDMSDPSDPSASSSPV